VPLPDRQDFAAVLHASLGELEQVPPAFSAKKLAGVPAYELARRGRAVEMTAVRVTLHHVAVEAFSAPFVEVRLTCSAGFYVRAMADTLGKRLGCGACLDALRRTASGPFTLEGAMPLAQLEAAPGGAVHRLVPPEQALPGVPAVVLTAAGVRRALHGNDVGPGDWTGPTDLGSGFVQLVAPDGRLLAVARSSGEPGVLHPAVVLG
jgi:tRNA pseudouridine55 synthase